LNNIPFSQTGIPRKKWNAVNDSSSWLKGIKSTLKHHDSLNANIYLSKSMPNLHPSIPPQQEPVVSYGGMVTSKNESFFMTDLKTLHGSQNNTDEQDRRTGTVDQGNTQENEVNYYDDTINQLNRSMKKQEIYQEIVNSTITVNHDTKTSFATLALREEMKYPYLYSTSSFEEHPMTSDLNYYHPKKKSGSFYPVFPKTMYRIETKNNINVGTPATLTEEQEEEQQWMVEGEEERNMKFTGLQQQQQQLLQSKNKEDQRRIQTSNGTVYVPVVTNLVLNTTHNLINKNGTICPPSPSIPPVDSLPAKPLSAEKRRHISHTKTTMDEKKGKIPVTPNVLENDMLSIAPSYYTDGRNKQIIYSPTHPRKKVNSASKRLKKKNLKILAETSKFFQSIIKEDGLLTDDDEEEEAEEEEEPSLFSKNRSRSPTSFSEGRGSIVLGGDGGGGGGGLQESSLISNLSQSIYSSSSISPSSFIGQQHKLTGNSAITPSSYLLYKQTSHGSVPTAVSDSLNRPSSSSVNHIVSDLRGTIPTSPLAPQIVENDEAFLIDEEGRQQKQREAATARSASTKSHTLAASFRAARSQLPSSHGIIVKTDSKLGIAELCGIEGNHNNLASSSSIPLQLSGHTYPLASSSMLNLSSSLVTSGANPLNVVDPGKPNLLRPTHHAHLPHLILTTNTTTTNTSTEASGIYSRPTSDIMYQMDNQAIYQSYYPQISPGNRQHPTLNSKGSKNKGMNRPHAVVISDESPLPSRTGSRSIRSSYDPQDEDDQPQQFIQERESRNQTKGGGMTAKKLKEKRENFVLVKPHRRLRAMSAERKVRDLSINEEEQQQQQTQQQNTVWVGMKDYRAATHKLPLNRSFKLKLPSLQ
jgi:hypothetical protein